MTPTSHDPVVLDTPEFVIVTVEPQDTFTSLARRYLNDTDKAWTIPAYNRIESLTPGQRVAIPRVTLFRGGIWRNGYQTVPVLLYPKLSNTPSNSQTVSAKAFDRQLIHLQENGFATVSLDQFYRFLTLQGQLPPKSVIITFDTTDRWVYEIVLPILKRRSMNAVLFIQLNKIGTKDHLTWPQLTEMTAGGFNIGIHGLPFVSPNKKVGEQSIKTFEKQFTDPKKIFTTRLKRTCRDYAYAGGISDDMTIAMLKKHGYRMAFTRQGGTNPFFSDNYKIKRYVIRGPSDIARFNRNLKTFQNAELE